MIKSVNFPSFEAPAVLKQKAVYMNSPEFLNDCHNKKMLDLGEQLGKLREQIAEEIKIKNQSGKEEIVQGINGYSRIKKYLDKNFKMNFWEEATFRTPTENAYYILKNFQIGNLGRKIIAGLKK